jgi:putative ABC transport system permease protein
VQLVLPEEVIEELVDTVISVRDLLLLAALSIGVATLLVTTLVFLLSIQLRKREIATMKSIGAAPGVVRGVLLSEILMVIGLSLLLAGLYILVLQYLGIPLLEKYL